MKKPTLLTGIMLAAIMTGLAVGIDVVATFLVGRTHAFSLMILSVACAYSLFILWYFKQRSGRAVCGLLLIFMPMVAYALQIEPITAVGIGIAAICLCRGLVVYKGVIPMLLDSALCLFSALLAVICTVKTSSVIIGIWVFFLLQSLFIYLPTRINRNAFTTLVESPEGDFSVGFTGQVSEQLSREASFNKAYRSAQGAVERLTGASDQG